MKLNFARNFVTLRKKNQMTQEAIAEKCGVTRSAVAKWENGGSLPDISMVATICELFAVSADDLLFNDLYDKRFEELPEDVPDNGAIMAKMNQIIDELRKTTDYKNRDLFKSYVDYNRAYTDEDEYESELCYDIGCEAYEQGQLSDALDYLDRAVEFGSIRAIMMAMYVRREVMDLVDGEDSREYWSQLSDFGVKIQQYGQIIQAVLNNRFN